MENYRKKPKKRRWSAKIGLESGSRLRVGKVLAPYNVRPKTVPLIEWVKWMWYF